LIAAALLIVPAAVVLDLCIGDPRRLPHPVAGIGRLIAWLEKALRRCIANERAGGILLLALTVACTYSLAYLLLQVAYAVSPSVGWAAAVYISWVCLAARSLQRESALVAAALVRGDIVAARRSLAMIVGRDTAGLDEQQIWRATVETVAENASDGVIAPLFYLMLGGPALALAYKAINTLDSMVGYKNERYLHFGWASARCDDLANYLPARFTGLLMVIAAPFAGLSGRNAWQIMLRDGRNHASPNSGIPEAAAAGALGVQLGGLNYYFGEPVEKPTIGDACRSLSLEAYRGAVRLMYGALFLSLGVWLLVQTMGWS
jgi:adenosylcobinamide-phosphate synthase